ncbi:hypothetical protein CbuK_1350 [Coxiella burnetii CbuK_Q154]|nr:hypothetical protein CbuK_1350 [Coxiella burnetii CbuK_Q154]
MYFYKPPYCKGNFVFLYF